MAKAENKKLEAAVDLLADYGGFDRDYLKDKLLINSSKEKPDNKNKMAEVAKLFGKRLGEEFKIKDLMSEKIYIAIFDNCGMRAYVEGFPHSEKPRWDMIMRLILGGSAVIVDE